MIKIEKTEVYGWEAAIRGMRNPMNSWDKSDSYETHVEDDETLATAKYEFFVGKNDLNLMWKLCAAGTDHRKFLRMITVTADITAPLYWWKEYDTYKVGTVANSCSTMHKIHSKPFSREDFSCDRMSDKALSCLDRVISVLEEQRLLFIETKDTAYWHDMIQLLPSSYNQKRTVMLNYEVLGYQYYARRGHKLKEWNTYCDWIATMPYWKEIFCEDEDY